MTVSLTACPTATVTTRGEALIIDNLALRDAELVAYVAEHDEAARVAIIERALRVGLMSLRGAGVTVNVDYIQREFERLVRQTDESHEKAAAALETSLRETFADGEGRLPRTLESFLGDRGTLRHYVEELFDEERRDSAIGKMRTLLGGYFDGDGAVVARMLDARRDDSPLHGFRGEVRDGLKELGERLVRLEASREARADERARGTAKGGDFEDAIEARLAVIVRGCGDAVERTTLSVGESVSRRAGDFVLTLNPTWTRGITVRVAVEAKSGPMGLTAVCRELDEARTNRGAAVAMAVYASGCAPTGMAPLTLHGDHVICEYDPDDPDDCALETAVRLARALALASCRETGADIDVARVRRHLESARNHLKAVTGMKGRLTSIAGATGEVSAALETLRKGVLTCIGGMEEEMARGDSTASRQEVA